MKDNVKVLETNIRALTEALNTVKAEQESVFSLKEQERIASAESKFNLYAPMAFEAQRKGQFLPSIETQEAWMDAQDEVVELCLIHWERTQLKDLKPDDRARELARRRKGFQQKDLVLPLNEKISYLRRWQAAKDRAEKADELFA